jgi:tetratricopeptide (TPR) repeat protein
VTRSLGKACKSLLAVFAITVAGVGAALANVDQCDVKRDAAARALDEMTWNRLNAIYGEISEEQYSDAFEDLQKMLERADRDTYLQAIINQSLGHVEWSRENYQSSLGFFEKAVELDALPDQAHFALMYQIAQLYSMQERYPEALQRLESWFCAVPPESITPAAYVLQASLFLEQKDYTRVLKAIEAAIAMDADPAESWYQLKLAAHYELEQYPQAAETLQAMVSKWPDRKVYWTQLSQICYLLEQEEKSLAVLALAYRKGLLDKQSDILYLSSLYANAEVPYKAAEVLEKGIRDGIVEPGQPHWTAVAESWYAADELEKSLAAYGEAGKVAGDGDIYLRRGFILVDLERWPAAVDSLDLALEKGGLDDRRTGEAYLLRGMAQFNLGKLDSASADWGRAERYEQTREAARQWMNSINGRD